LKEAPSLLNERFFLQTWDSDPYYGLAYAKIRMAGTAYVEAASGKSKAQNGIFIDVIPYDVYPDKESDRKWQGKRFDLYKRQILVKCGYTPWVTSSSGIKRLLKGIGYIPLRLSAAVQSRKKLIQKYKDMAVRFNEHPTGYCYLQDGASNYGEWVIPSECLTELDTVKFEGENFLAPKNYDLLLKTIYGDYMKLPPESERQNRHQLIDIRFPEE